MRGQLIREMNVLGASADEIWAVYISPDLPRLLGDVLIPDIVEKIDILEGDGRVGTVLHVVLSQGHPEPREWKEKFVNIDHDNRVKVIQMTEGGFLVIDGFSFHEFTVEITKKNVHSCVIKLTITFHLDDKFESNASLVTIDDYWSMAKAIVNFVLHNKTKGDCNDENKNK